jgi:hypothetical protein
MWIVEKAVVEAFLDVVRPNVSRQNANEKSGLKKRQVRMNPPLLVLESFWGLGSANPACAAR